MNRLIFRLRNFTAFILIVGLSLTNCLAAVDKEKRITKSYQVNNDVRLSIKNKFGTVEISTWDKKQIDVEVVVIVRKSSESAAQDLLDRIQIDINDKSPSSYIGFSTEIGRGSSSRGDDSFEINYRVSMPAKNPLDLANKHGDVYISDFEGELNLRVAHGKVKAENLKGKSEIDLSFGSGRIKSMASGFLDIQHYNRLAIEQLGDIKIDIQHSSLTADEGGRIRIDCQHSNVDFGRIVEVEGDFQHSDFVIDEVEERVVLDVQHMDLDIYKINKGFKRIDIDASFTDVNLNIDRTASGQIDAQVQFGDLKYRGEGFDFSYVEKKTNQSYFKGKFGGGSGGIINLQGQHGNFKLTLVD